MHSIHTYMLICIFISIHTCSFAYSVYAYMEHSPNIEGDPRAYYTGNTSLSSVQGRRFVLHKCDLPLRIHTKFHISSSRLSPYKEDSRMLDGINRALYSRIIRSSTWAWCDSLLNAFNKFCVPCSFVARLPPQISYKWFTSIFIFYLKYVLLVFHVRSCVDYKQNLCSVRLYCLPKPHINGSLLLSI